MDVIKRSGILIPKQYKNTKGYIKIKKSLERMTKVYNKSDYVLNTFFLESDKFLLIPRNFPIQDYIEDVIIHDHKSNGEPIEISHNIKPRGEVQERAIEYIMTHEDGLLQLAPGVGKTVISIYMIAERKLRTIIIVHRDALADQWRDRILSFTNVTSDNIARLSSKTFKEDLKKPIIITTAQSFISLLKRNRKEFLISLNESNIGVMIADEVHTSVGAPTFSECSIHVPARYTYGLSATPYRIDGNEDIIQFHLGQIFSDDDITGTVDAKVTVFLLDYKIDIPMRHKYIYWAGDFQKSRYLNMIKKSTPFMEVLKGILNKVKDERKTICIVERINLIEELYNWLPTDDKSKFCGNAKADTLEKTTTFSTPGKCRDGIDAPWKDCVIMTSPISNVEQLAGRITRTFKDKERPSVIDMIDYGCKRISKTFYKRKEFYNKKNWTIQYIIIKNGKYSLINEEIALKIIEEGGE